MTHAELIRSFDQRGRGLVYGYDADGYCFSMYIGHQHDLATCPKHLVYTWADETRPGPPMERYRFGQRTYTVAAIQATGHAHGRDGICFYPPSRWGLDDHERDNPSCMNLDATYHKAYDAGKASRETAPAS